MLFGYMINWLVHVAVANIITNISISVVPPIMNNTRDIRYVIVLLSAQVKSLLHIVCNYYGLMEHIMI